MPSKENRHNCAEASAFLKTILERRVVIVGVGNTLRGDDGFGPALVARIRGNCGAVCVDAGTVPENYIQTIARKKPQTLLVVDAMDFGAEPGEIGLFKVEQLGSAAISTHTLSPRLFVDLIRAEIDVQVCFVGIQPAGTGFGESVSVPVGEAVARLSKALKNVFSVAS